MWKRKKPAEKHPKAKSGVSTRLLWILGGTIFIAAVLVGAWYVWDQKDVIFASTSEVQPCSPVKPDENYEEANRLDLDGDLRRDSYFKSGQEYTIAENATFRIPDGKTLIIEPGARVKFGEGSKMVVEGALLACGRSSRRILFTANTTTGIPGFWGGIELRDADPETVIGHASFEYGGRDYQALIWVEGSDVQIEDLKFDANQWYPLSLDPNSTPVVRPPLEVENGPQGWEIRAGEMTSAQTWTSAQPYVVRDLLVIAEDGSLSISAGAIIRFLPEAAINIKGDFTVLGESGNPVRLTSYNDNEDDESSPEPKPGDWVGLRFYGREGESKLEYVDIAYGGQEGYRERGCLWMENANPQLVNVSVSACDGFAMSSDIASDPVIDKLSLDEQDPLRRWELRGSTLETAAGRSLELWTTTDGEALSPVVTGWVGVAEDSSLDVAPGLAMIFAQGDTGFWADGDLRINGERKKPVLLTSIRDPEFSAEGGAQAGDWRGLHLKNSQAENTSLTYLTLRYGGGDGSACLQLVQASPTVKNMTVSECAGYPVSSDAFSQPAVEELDIEENAQANLWEIRESNLDQPKTLEWIPLLGKDKAPITRLVTGVVTIGPEASLELSPGLVVKFTDGKGIKAQGALLVNGSKKEPVIMTSWRDPVGGGEASGSQPGDWGGVVLEGAAGSALSFLEIRYAGIAANRVGCLNLTGSQPVLTDLTISGCSYYPITSDLASQPVVENLLMVNNQPADEWAIRESQLARGEQRSWEPIRTGPGNQPVLRTVTGVLGIEDGSTLSISPGVIIKFGETAGLHARGSLAIEGEKNAPVILTSWRDGEFSQQGEAQPGDWAGLVLEGSQGNFNLTDVVIRYAGGNGSPRGAIALVGASPSLRGVKIQDGAWYPLSLDAVSKPSLEGIEFSSNTPADAVEVRPEAIEAGGETVWSPWEDAHGQPLPRVVNGVLSIGAQASLRLEPGVVVKFAEAGGLEVGGSLNVEDAVLTSLHDDDFGGDSDGSLSGEKSWQGVTLRNRNLLRFQGGLIRFARFGLTLIDTAPELSNLQIQDSWEAAIGIDLLSTPQVSDLKLENNAVNGAVIQAESLSEGAAQWNVIGDPDQQLLRVIRAPLVIAPGAQLSIAPGAIVKFDRGAGLVIEGQLDAGNSSREPVFLTALADDAHGGDTDNASRDPARGEWVGLQLNPNNTPVAVRLEGMSILYAATGIDILNPVNLQVSDLTIAETQAFGMTCQTPLPVPLEEMEIEFENNGEDVSGCVETILVSP